MTTEIQAPIPTRSRGNRIFWSFSYLVTFALWMYCLDVNFRDVSEVFVWGILSVIFSLFTFLFVGIGLRILLFPVRVLVNLGLDILGLRKVTPAKQVGNQPPPAPPAPGPNDEAPKS